MTHLADSIREHADHSPEAIAIEGAGVSLSWRELAELLPEIARRLAKDHGGAARPLALQLDHGVAECLADIALIEAGIPSVQLPPFFTEAQRTHAIAAAGCSDLVASALLTGDARDPLRLAVQPQDADRAPLPQGTSKISFTSGSTGQPKGICLSAGNLIGVAEAVVRTVGNEHAGRHLPLLPPGILLENVAGLYATLIAGGTYVALPQAEIGFANPFRPDFRRAIAAIQANAITSLILVPEYLARLVAAMEASGTRLPNLTLVAVGGARLSCELLKRALALGLPVRQGYGLTECGSVVTLETADEGLRGSVGQSLGINRIEIAADGEIVIHGPAYLGTVGAPREQEPLRTGDIGRLDEAGRLWVDGRKSNLIVTSFGRNVSPEWVEAALLDQPAILQAMVRGDGEATLAALIVPSFPDADIAAAVASANSTLPPYAQIYGWQVVPPFTPANGMLTGNGRMRREAIAAAYSEPMPGRPFFERLVAETREAQARFAAIPQLQAGLTGRISRADYIAYLTQAYHHVRHTVPLMEEARSRLAGRPELVAALDEYIEEERGHEAWILDDIDAAGGDSRAAAANAPAAAAAMVDHAYATIRTGRPAAFFGMVYVLEGTSIALATTGASAVRASLGLPAEAFRYLTSHGALDQQHMRFFEGLMNRLDDPADQGAIIAMAKDIFVLFGGVFRSIELEGAREAA
ncbi:MAG: AMP-binding protein [Sphingomonadales bacterium]